MVRPDGSASLVLLRAHPESESTPSLRKDGRLLATIDEPGVLRLLHITKASGHPLWVYDGFEAVSMERVLQVLGVQGEYLPIHTCLDLVAAAADGVSAALAAELSASEDGRQPPTVYHPGVAPSELLLDISGRVKVAGFRVRRGDSAPGPASAAYSDPSVTQDDAASAVYSLGTLLVHLLSGEAPAGGNANPERHAAIVRRALIRVLARPGEAVDEAVIATIRSCLSLDLEERPTLVELSGRLSSLASDASDAGVEEWAPVKISPILMQQEAGYPSEEETRKRRYVDATSLHSEEASRETPPARRPPREVATILAKPGEGLSLAVGQAKASQVDSLPTGETKSGQINRKSIGEADESLSLPMPLADTIISSRGAAGIDIPRAGKPGPSGVSLEIRTDEWNDLDAPTQARGGSGWVMVLGVIAGMILAGLMVWVVIDRVLPSASEWADTETSRIQDEAMQRGAAADAMADGPVDAPTPAADAPAADAPAADPPAADAPAAQEPAPAVEPERDARVEPPGPPAAKAPAPEAVEPERDKPKKPKKPAESAPDRFTVTFKSADPAVTRMVVRCHIGKGSGSTQVRLTDAGRGPCKVIGYRGEQGKVIVSAVITGPRSFTCFSNGSRACQ